MDVNARQIKVEEERKHGGKWEEAGIRMNISNGQYLPKQPVNIS